MFHQTFFNPSGKQQQQTQRCRSPSAGVITGSAAVTVTTVAVAGPVSVSNAAEKPPSWMDPRKYNFCYESQTHHHGFGLGSSVVDGRNADFVHFTPAQHKEPGTIDIARHRFSSYVLSLASPLFANNLTDGEIESEPEPEPENQNSFCRPIHGNSFFKTRLCSDTDTATTASISTSVSSPTSSLLSNSSSLDGGSEAEAKTIEFVLENNGALPDRNCKEEEENPNFMDTHQDYDHEYEGFDDVDGDEDDSYSCCTPVLKNTFRPQQLFPQQKQAFVSREKGSMMTTTTTTTEIKTTTTTTTQKRTASSVNTLESVSSTTIPRTNTSNKDAFLSPDLFSKISEGHQSDVPFVSVQNKRRSNNAVVVPCQDRETHSAVTTATTLAVKAQPPCCKHCAAKECQIENQQKEMSDMKGMMQKLCLLLVDTVSSQENISSNGDDNSRPASDGETRKPDPPASRRISRPDGSCNKDEDDLPATDLTSSTSSFTSTSSSCALPTSSRRRITSLSVTSVGRDCPRTKKMRIRVNGQWGTYSGPTPDGKPNSPCDNECDEPPEAGIFHGCVVRMDEGDMYVGSLSRNDTGSFTFYPPGTLYDRNRKPIRRIR